MTVCQWKQNFVQDWQNKLSSYIISQRNNEDGVWQEADFMLTLTEIQKNKKRPDCACPG